MYSNNFCNNCGTRGHLFHQCKLPITSTGIIVYNKISSNEYKYLMIRRKDSLGYVDFMRGKYHINNKTYIMNIINEMTMAEKNNILSSREINGILVPNLFMPPLYPIFLFILKKILFNSESYVIVVLLIQLCFHLLSAHMLKKILNLLFEKKFSNLGFLIFLFFPLSIYAVSQISSINLQVLLLLIFIYKCPPYELPFSSTGH
jgi:hypothetical protein